MARRRRDRDDLEILELLGRLVFLLVFVSLFSPSVRNAIRTLGFIALLLVGLALVAGAGFLIWRSILKRRRLAQGIVPLRVFDLNRLEPEVIVSPSPPLANLRIDVTPSTPQEMGVAELLERLKQIDWFQFEKVVGLLYRKLGYTVTRCGGANPDGGIDLVIENAGQRSAFQCKQWKKWNVGVKAVREFLGALTDAGIQKGIFIALCGYTGEAKQLADKHGIEIIDEMGLVRMIESTDANCDPEVLDLLRDTRKFCPKCESEMVLRTASKGPSASKQFWGCSTYPRCRYILHIT